MNCTHGPNRVMIRRYDVNDYKHPGECAQCVLEERDDLKDALRWRKWPEERPNDRQWCLVIENGVIFLDCWHEEENEWAEADDADDITRWLPIPPMGKE